MGNPLLHPLADIPIFRRVSITRLLSILALLALMIAPISMLTGGAAMAATASQSAASAEHCGGMSGDHDKPMSNATHDCTTTCSAIAPVAQQVAEKTAGVAAVHHPMMLAAFEGVGPKAETPPPRFSRRI